ncbi:MAG: hypothetical protein WC617_12820 [Rhodanobacter sp.]
MEIQESPGSESIATTGNDRRQINIWGSLFLGVLGSWLFAVGLSRFSEGPIPIVDTFISIGPLVFGPLLLVWFSTRWFRKKASTGQSVSDGAPRVEE